MSEAEKELKFGSWRWELAHDRSGKEMIWGDGGPSERDFSPPTSLKEKRALSCSIYHVSSIPLAAIFLSRHKVKVAQTHWSRWPEALASSPGHLRRQAVCVQLPWSTLLLQWCILSLVCSICLTSHSFFSLHPLIRLCLPWPCLFLTRANVDGSFLLSPIAGFDDIITERRQQVCHTSPQTKTERTQKACFVTRHNKGISFELVQCIQGDAISKRTQKVEIIFVFRLFWLAQKDDRCK